MSSNQSSLATPVIKWAHREDDQYCHVLLPFDRVFTVTLFENTADRERFNSHLCLSEREGSLRQLAYYSSWRLWRNSLTCFQKTNSRQQHHTGVFNVCCTHLILPTSYSENDLTQLDFSVQHAHRDVLLTELTVWGSFLWLRYHRAPFCTITQQKKSLKCCMRLAKPPFV